MAKSQDIVRKNSLNALAGKVVPKPKAASKPKAAAKQAKAPAPKPAKPPRAPRVQLDDDEESSSALSDPEALLDDMPDDIDHALDGEPDLEVEPAEAQWLVGSPAANSEEKRRKAVVPPANAKTGMNLFDYLHTCTPPIDKKIADIAVAQTQVPSELRGDAAQEIYLVWSMMKPDLSKYKPGQIASYAHRMAKHTALRLRRDLGASVRLPGSAFRKRRDGSSYVTPGVLSVPLIWEELEGWLDADEASSEPMAGMSMGGVGEEEIMNELSGMLESYSAEDNEEEILKERLAVLEKFKDKLTERQFQILMRLSRGDTYEEIQRVLNIKKGVMMRELNAAACVIGPL